MHPPGQSLVVVFALVWLARTMQPHVHPICGDLLWRDLAPEVVDAESRIMSREQLVNASVKPARIAEFKGKAIACRQLLEERAQAISVSLPFWRQLEQDGAEPVAEFVDPFHESGDGLIWILELLHVGEVTAGFDGKKEARRRTLSPGTKGFHLGQPVERIVDLDRGKSLCVIGKPFLRRQFIRVETAPPMAIVPARCPNPESIRHLQPNLSIKNCLPNAKPCLAQQPGARYAVNFCGGCHPTEGHRYGVNDRAVKSTSRDDSVPSKQPGASRARVGGRQQQGWSIHVRAVWGAQSLDKKSSLKGALECAHLDLLTCTAASTQCRRKCGKSCDEHGADGPLWAVPG